MTCVLSSKTLKVKVVISNPLRVSLPGMNLQRVECFRGGLRAFTPDITILTQGAPIGWLLGLFVRHSVGQRRFTAPTGTQTSFVLRWAHSVPFPSQTQIHAAKRGVQLSPLVARRTLENHRGTLRGREGQSIFLECITAPAPIRWTFPKEDVVRWDGVKAAYATRAAEGIPKHSMYAAITNS